MSDNKHDLKASPFLVHCFICTQCQFDHEKTPEEAQTLKEKVKKKAYERYPKGVVRINSSGCLGHCESGISSVIYPEGKMILKLKKGDEKVLLDEIEKAYKNVSK